MTITLEMLEAAMKIISEAQPPREIWFILSPENYDRSEEMIKVGFCKPHHILSDAACLALWAEYQKTQTPASK